MLENATITLKYSELKTLIDTAEEGKNYMEKCLELEKKLEDKAERKALDKIIDTLIKANDSKIIKVQQAYIKECIEIYCNIFGIPIAELIEE